MTAPLRVPSPRACSETGAVITGPLRRGPSAQALAGFDPWAAETSPLAEIERPSENLPLIPGNSATQAARASRSGDDRASRELPQARQDAAAAIAEAKGQGRGRPRSFVIAGLGFRVSDITGMVCVVMGAALFATGLATGAEALVFAGAMLVYVAATVMGPQV